MRADEGQPPVELRRAPVGERLAEQIRDLRAATSSMLGCGRIVLGISTAHRQGPIELRPMVGPGDRRVCGSERRAQFGSEAEAGLDQLRAEGDELVIPDVQRGELIAPDAADLRGLEQRGALLSTRS